MNQQQIAELAPRLGAFLKEFRCCFATDCGFEHLGTYSRGLMSNLARKSVEPIALAAGAAVRTLQEFLTFYDWDEQAVRDRLQWHLVARDMPAPGMPLDALGVIGLVDETSSVKKGTQTPGVQRQYCGAVGKIENRLVTVHLGYLHGAFKTLIDSDLFLPERGLMRHLVLCQLVMLFLARETARLRGEKSGANARTDGAGTQRHLPPLAGSSVQAISA